MNYDVIIIGGGPAGMMAAGHAGELGAKVLLIEKNKDLGMKLLLTGKGRCNLTNLEDNLHNLIEKFGKNGKFLFSAFSKFSPEKVVDFFESKGLKTKIEDNNRVFPESNRSLDVRQTLLNYLFQSKVDVLNNAKVKDIVAKGNNIKNIVLTNGKILTAKKYVLTTGGKSYPQTGSTGDGYVWLEKLGHTLIKLKPALTPVICNEKFVEKLEGLSLSTKVIVFQDDAKIEEKFGDLVFTKNGLSGPVILNMSKKIGECLKKGKVEIEIDFIPNLTSKDLDLELQQKFQKNSNKIFKNILVDLIPSKSIPSFIDLSKINLEKKVNLITKEERKNLAKILKKFRLTVRGLGGFDKAMITSGGVKLSEIDSKNMQSKIINNLYFAGEILDLDGPTGGYNLQICWSTGFVAGESVSE